MFLRRVVLQRAILNELPRRALHVGRVLQTETNQSKPKAAEAVSVPSKDPVSKQAKDPKQADKPPSHSPTNTEKTKDDGEGKQKIEYIGNTRFPRPRPKPRKTITPGDAVGQAAQAGKIERVPLRRKVEQKWRDILSPEKNMESRAKIIREIGESHWQNILDLRDNGEKLFEAPKALIPTNRARYLPNLEGKTLNGHTVDIAQLCKGKTTLLTIEFVKFAEKHTKSYINVFEKTFANNSNNNNKKTQVVQVNIEENWVKAAVLKMCLPYTRRIIPKHRHNNYVVHFGNVEGLRNILGIANPLLGYAFLIDSKTRIRWYANGEAIKSEAATMISLTQELMRLPH